MTDDLDWDDGFARQVIDKCLENVRNEQAALTEHARTLLACAHQNDAAYRVAQGCVGVVYSVDRALTNVCEALDYIRKGPGSD